MALFTIGGLVTGLGVLWGYRHGVFNAVKWKTREYQEPSVGQVWSFAKLKPLESTGKELHKLTVTAVTDSTVEYLDNWDPENPEEGTMDLDEWHQKMRDSRAFVLEHESIEDTYWGDASED